MRLGPLHKISCHPFFKIFVNLVSSVCGFISTCINVSSLVTKAHYLEEDIIKNVWGEGRGARWAAERGEERKVKLHVICMSLSRPLPLSLSLSLTCSVSLVLSLSGV